MPTNIFKRRLCIAVLCGMINFLLPGCTTKDFDATFLDPTFLNISVAGAIGGDSIVAAGSEVQYGTYSLKNDAPYTWTVPSDAEIIQGTGTNKIVVRFGLDSGEVRVSAGDVLGSITSKVQFKVTGPGTQTTGISATYLSTATLMNGVTYEWTVPEDATITSGASSNSITVIFSTPGDKMVTCKASSNSTVRTGFMPVSVN